MEKEKSWQEKYNDLLVEVTAMTDEKNNLQTQMLEKDREISKFKGEQARLTGELEQANLKVTELGREIEQEMDETQLKMESNNADEVVTDVNDIIPTDISAFMG